MAVALDDWVYVRRKARGPDDTSWQGLVTVAKAADPDPERCGLRSLWEQEVTDETRKEMAQLAAPERLQTLSPTTLDLLARTLDKGGLFQERLRVLQCAVRLYSGDFWLHYEAGHAYLECRPPRVDEGIQHYTAALAIRPRSTVVVTGLASCLQYQGKLNEAIVWYRKAIEIDPRIPGAHSDLGYALYKQGKLDEAIACYRKSIELDPKNAGVFGNLGVVLSKQGKLDEAIACWRTVIELDPKDANTCTGLAWRLATAEDVKLRSPKEAVEFARKAIELQPDDSNNWDNLGVAQYRAGDWHAALDALVKAREMQGGDDPQHQFFLAMTYWQLGKCDEAVKTYDEAVAWLDGGELPEEQYRFRDEAEELISPEAIVSYFTARITDDPQSSELFLQRAAAYAHAGQVDKAARDFIQASELSVPDGWNSRSAAFASLAEAEEVFARIAELRPDDLNLWAERGNYFALRSQWKQALTGYARASDPDYELPHACTLLLAGDGDGYRRLCLRMAERFGQTDKPPLELALACSLSPRSGVEPARIVEWAGLAARSGRDKFTLEPLAYARLRAGQFDEAVRLLQEAMTLPDPEPQSNAAFPLALAYHGLGQEEESRKWYQIGVDKLKKITPPDADTPVSWAPAHWLNVNVWYREAKTVFYDFSSQTIVGSCGCLITPEDTDNDTRPDLWFRDEDGDGANDLAVVLPPLASADRCQPRAINSLGRVVGTSPDPKGRRHLVVWDADERGRAALTDLGRLGEDEACGEDINDLGQVVGETVQWNPGWYDSTTAFLWQNGRAIMLNNLITDTAGLYLSEATGINNWGDIVGVGYLNGEQRAFIAIPSTSP